MEQSGFFFSVEFRVQFALLLLLFAWGFLPKTKDMRVNMRGNKSIKTFSISLLFNKKQLFTGGIEAFKDLDVATNGDIT